MVCSNDKEKRGPQKFVNLGPQLPCYALYTGNCVRIFSCFNHLMDMSNEQRYMYIGLCTCRIVGETHLYRISEAAIFTIFFNIIFSKRQSLNLTQILFYYGLVIKEP